MIYSFKTWIVILNIDLDLKLEFEILKTDLSEYVVILAYMYM